MVTKKNLLPREIFEKFSTDIFHCSSCNYCVDAIWAERGIHHVCTTMEHFSENPSYSGKGFLAAARALADGVELDLEGLASRVSTCTGCGNCETLCPIGLKPAQLGKDIRSWLTTEGYSPAEAEIERTSIIQSGRSYSQDSMVLQNLSGERSSEQADVSFFIGCASSATGSNELESIRDILRNMGLKVAWINVGESCCGASLSELGYSEEGNLWRQQVSKKNIGKEIIVSGYECFWHLNNNLNLNLTTFPNWFFKAIEEMPIKLQLKSTTVAPGKIFLIETCQLKKRDGREASVLSDESLLVDFLGSQNIEIENKSYPSPYAMCCSAGGGMPKIQPAASREAAKDRSSIIGLNSVAVTLDPRCAYHFDNSLDLDSLVFGFAQFINNYFEIIEL